MNTDKAQPVEEVLLLHETPVYVAVHLSYDGSWFDGTVYPITHWEQIGTGLTGYHYESVDGQDDSLETHKNARYYFQFKFCWRGVWEGRIYPERDGNVEWWDEELLAMAGIWKQLEPILKERIKKAHPEHYYDED